MVVTFLMGILSTLVYGIVVRGFDFYRESVTSMEIRQEALLGMTRLTQELRQTAITTVKPEVGKGVVFPSLRDASGNLRFHADGKLYWQSFVGYYLDDLDGTKALFRRAEDITTDTFRAPDPYTESPIRDCAYFLGIPGGGKRLICRHVQSFEVELGNDVIDIRSKHNLSSRTQHLFSLVTRVLPRQ